MEKESNNIENTTLQDKSSEEAKNDCETLQNTSLKENITEKIIPESDPSQAQTPQNNPSKPKSPKFPFRTPKPKITIDLDDYKSSDSDDLKMTDVNGVEITPPPPPPPELRFQKYLNTQTYPFFPFPSLIGTLPKTCTLLGKIAHVASLSSFKAAALAGNSSPYDTDPQLAALIDQNITTPTVTLTNSAGESLLIHRANTTGLKEGDLAFFRVRVLQPRGMSEPDKAAALYVAHAVLGKRGGKLEGLASLEKVVDLCSGEFGFWCSGV